MSEVQASNTVMLASKAQAQSQGISLRSNSRRVKSADLWVVITDQSIQTRTLLGMISRLGPAFDDIAQQIQSLQAQQEAERHRATSLAALDKLSSFVYHARYTQILQLRLNETCRWVLVEPQYIAWTEEKSSGMIQLSGKSITSVTLCVSSLQSASGSREVYDHGNSGRGPTADGKEIKSNYTNSLSFLRWDSSAKPVARPHTELSAATAMPIPNNRHSSRA